MCKLWAYRRSRGTPTTTDKFRCPTCGVWKSRVVDSRPDTEGLRYLRLRVCVGCHHVFKTAEEAIGKPIPWHDQVDASDSTS